MNMSYSSSGCGADAEGRFLRTLFNRMRATRYCIVPLLMMMNRNKIMMINKTWRFYKFAIYYKKRTKF